jgi:hypothetical protein
MGCMVVSLMTDRETVKYTVGPMRPRASFWIALGLAILAPFAVPGAIKDSGVAGGLFGLLFWEAILIYWAYKSVKPVLRARQWEQAGEYEMRDWSPQERGLERGKLLVYLYRAGSGSSQTKISVDALKRAGEWTLAELHNLLSPLGETGIVDVDMRMTDNEVGRVIAFYEARVGLTPAGVLATEDAVAQARQRPGYSVTIHGNDNQVQVATVNSEQLRNT